VLSVVIVYELGYAAKPFHESQLSIKQLQIRDAYQGSKVAAPLVRAIYKPFITLLQPALPSDPQIYFSRDPVNQ
jgi:hypothetical protein